MNYKEELKNRILGVLDDVKENIDSIIGGLNKRTYDVEITIGGMGRDCVPEWKVSYTSMSNKFIELKTAEYENKKLKKNKEKDGNRK